MRPAGALLLAAALGAQDGPARVEIAAPSAALVGESVEIVVRFALDRSFFAEQAVPLLQRRVDLPVQLEVPWLAVPGRQPVEVVAGDGPSVVVGDRIVRAFALAAEERDGRTWDRYEVRSRWTGSDAGDHELGAVTLRYAHTTAFEETLLGGRQPVDRREAEVAGAPARIAVIALPGEAPPAFTGAIGEFACTLTAAVGQVEVGDSFALEFTVRGAGNLARFAPPPWPRLDGFAIQGLAERDGDGARRFVFDVLALREGARLQAFLFDYFSPAQMAYRTAAAMPPTVRVVARSPGRTLPPRVQRLVDAGAAAGTGIAWYWWLAIAAGILGPALLLAGSRRRRR